MLFGAILKEKGRPAVFLREIFDALDGMQREYDWLITDWECYPQTPGLRHILSGDACWLAGKELDALIRTEDVQWIWGAFSAFRPDTGRENAMSFFPRVRDSGAFWEKPLVIQHPRAETELVACDSSAVLLLSRREELVRCFLCAFPAAKPLAKGTDGLILL